MAPTKQETYSGHIAKFMNFLNDTNHSNDHQYSDEELIQLTPNHIIKFFQFKVFKILDDQPINKATDRATGWRAILEAYKRSISYFMPNRIPSWDQMSQNGNPTKSTDINDFIKLVKKLEVRKKISPVRHKGH
jgi:hypothetical protein